MAALGPLGFVQNSSGGELGKRRHIPVLFILLGITLLLFGLARPEMIVRLPRVEGTVILAMDVSQSMSADDLEPTRIEAAKEAALAFIENQPRTIRIGVVAFSNGGLIVQQPTDDRAAILTTIDRLSPQGGTSLGQGIFSSLNAIAGEAIVIDADVLEQEQQPIQIGNYPSAVVLLLTDGQNTGPPDPLEIAQIAAEAGVRIYPVGIGTLEGTILEIDGFNMLAQLNEKPLKEIANLTNGKYFQAEDEESLQEIYENVDLELTISEEKTEITAVVAGISLIFLIIGGTLSLLWFGRVP
jgi:Ca-activated chloride channel family protein